MSELAERLHNHTDGHTGDIVYALREVAASLDNMPPRKMIPAQVIRASLRSLADEIEGDK